MEPVAEVAEVTETAVIEAADVTEAAEVPEVVETQAPEMHEPFEEATVTEVPEVAEAQATTEPIVVEETPAMTEAPAAVEVSAIAEVIEAADVVEEPEVTEIQKPVAESAAPEVTDFTLVMDPADVNNKSDETVVNQAAEPDTGKVADEAANKQAAEPDTGKVVGEVKAEAGISAEEKKLEAEYAAARAQGPAASTAITPIIPVTGYSDENTKKQKKAPKAAKMNSIFNKPVTRKFLTAALAATLVLNGAIAAGIMSLYTHGIKKDVAEVKSTVSDLENKSGNFGGGDQGFGQLPPGLGYGDEWNGGDNWYDDGSNNGDNYFGGDGDYGEHWNDDWDDDWDDDRDDDQDEATPYSGNNQGQQRSSGVSIGIVISDNNGVYISQVTGSNAQKAGFQAGDKIISFDGEEINDSNSLISEVQDHKSGDTVKVVVERNGKKVKIKTTLE
jgi:hypothetical protein